MLQLSFEIDQEIIVSDAKGEHLVTMRILRTNSERIRVEFDIEDDVRIEKGEPIAEAEAMEVLINLPVTPQQVGETELVRELGMKTKRVRQAIEHLQEKGYYINKGMGLFPDLNEPPTERLGLGYGLSVICRERAQKEGKIYVESKANR